MFIPDVINTLLMGLIFMVIVVTVIRPFVMHIVNGEMTTADMQKEAIEAALKDLDEAIKGSDKEAIEAKTEALGKASQKLGEKVYADMQAKQAAEAAGPGAEQSAKPADDNVVDAEVKEVKKG